MILALLIVLLGSPPAAGWRATGEAFGQPAMAEVRGLDAETAEPALRAALAELVAAETEAAALAAGLNAAAGDGPRQVDDELLALLERTIEFCRWSDAAHGPLGGALYELWQGALPSAAGAKEAAASAACDRLRLDRDAGVAELGAGSRIDLRGFAAGWAVDRAIEALRRAGADNGRVELGAIRRGIGPGPAGNGWAVDLRLPAEWVEPLGPVQLRNRALAVAGREPPLVIGGDRYSPHLNLRSGRPAEGTAAIIASSELAVDAQALAITMLVLGQREGMLRLGNLRPEPSVAWLLGSGEGRPLVATHRWTALR